MRAECSQYRASASVVHKQPGGQLFTTMHEHNEHPGGAKQTKLLSSKFAVVWTTRLFTTARLPAVHTQQLAALVHNAVQRCRIACTAVQGAHGASKVVGLLTVLQKTHVDATVHSCQRSRCWKIIPSRLGSEHTTSVEAWGAIASCCASWLAPDVLKSTKGCGRPASMHSATCTRVPLLSVLSLISLRLRLGCGAQLHHRYTSCTSMQDRAGSRH